MPIKVSVVVPVYNPGRYIDRCIASVLGQSLPVGEYEAIFVDDGSTDGTPARLDALAAAHPNISVIHQENSGWPGKPRNVGIDAARGEYVFFLDHDDALGPEALERLYAMAVRNDSDIVIGKMAGHGKGVPTKVFRENRDRATLADTPLIDSLTPHKLFRRAFLEREGLRYPEGRRRLEDHVFVVRAYFLAEVISVLADYVCYHHYARQDRSNASQGRFDPPYYYGYVREVLGIIESFTEPGSFRDSLLQRFARVELLGRLQGRRFLEHPPEYREVLFAEIRDVVEEHVPTTVDDRLAASFRIRLSLTRARRLDLLVAFAEAELRLVAWATLTTIEWVADRTVLHLVLDVGLEDGGPMGIGFERVGDELSLRLSPLFDGVVPDQARRLPRPESNQTSVTIRRRGDAAELVVPSTILPRFLDGHDGRIEPIYSIDAGLAPGHLATLDLLEDGAWDVVARVGLGGVVREAKVPMADVTPSGLGGRSSQAHRSAIRPHRTHQGSLSLRVELHTGPVGWFHGVRSLTRGSFRRLALRVRAVARARG
jgi:glycosyltransferase involved in cell wall biosynthesis